MTDVTKYHGYDLPRGMTHDLAEKIEKLIFGYADGFHEFEGLGPLDVGIKIFEAIRESQQSDKRKHHAMQSDGFTAADLAEINRLDRADAVSLGLSHRLRRALALGLCAEGLRRGGQWARQVRIWRLSILFAIVP